MAYEETLKSITLLADASVGVYTGVPGMAGSASPNSGKQFRFVTIGTTPETVGLTGAGLVADGVLQNKPQAVGQAATVGIYGVSMVESGAAVAAGDLVQADATSRAITQTSTNAVLGKAIKAATAAGQLIPVLLKLI